MRPPVTFTKKRLVAFVAVGAVLATAFAAVVLYDQQTTYADYAAAILETCADEEYRPACYDVEIPKLMDEGLSMEEAYEVTRVVQDRDDDYFYCHVLGHNLSAKETAKDPSKWKDVVARSPSGMCSNGGIHGAFQERFRAEALPDADLEELKPILSGICDRRNGWNPTSMEQATCTHALGHLAMYVTDGDIKKSLALCEEVALNSSGYDFTQLCFDGTFMQLFQPLEPEDDALIEGKEQTLKTVDAFCGQFEGMQYGSCRSESWPLYHEDITTASRIESICSTIADRYQQGRCFSALFYVVTPQLQFAPERVASFCDGFSSPHTQQCFANAASRMIETDARMIDDALGLCRFAGDYGADQACYRELVLYSTYNFHRGSPDALRLCKGMAEPWRTRCLAGQER